MVALDSRRIRCIRGPAMIFTVGILLVALTVGMVLVARPVAGEPARFLRSWIVGQIYIMGAMAATLAGVPIMINAWPF